MKAGEPLARDQRPQQVIVRSDRRIGAILAAAGKLGPRDIFHVLELQKTSGLRFGEGAVRLGLISMDDLWRALATQYDVPHLAPDRSDISRELVVACDPFHRCAEQMRALRSQLLMRWAGNAAQRRMLTLVSPAPGEGRSYAAANLAVAFAQLGQRTLLIDGDLRRPRQHRIFGVADRVGLSAVLSDRADLGAAVAVAQFAGLSLLPAGATPPNPVELLSRNSLGLVLEEAQAGFDIVLIDTPAASLYADAQTIAFHAGSALLFARKDRTRTAHLSRVIQELNDAGAQVLGTVFNAF